MLFPFLSLTDDEARRRALQAKYFADLVVKIPLVAIVEQILAIDKADEGWRASGSLRHILNFQPPALIRRRLHPGRGGGKHVVELAG